MPALPKIPLCIPKIRAINVTYEASVPPMFMVGPVPYKPFAFGGSLTLTDMGHLYLGPSFSLNPGGGWSATAFVKGGPVPNQTIDDIANSTSFTATANLGGGNPVAAFIPTPVAPAPMNWGIGASRTGNMSGTLTGPSIGSRGLALGTSYSSQVPNPLGLKPPSFGSWQCPANTTFWQ